MTFEMALAYLAGLNETRIRPGLERIEKVLSFFGAPHLKFPHVLIGGTNGKGSVVSMMGSVLESAGLKTGRYTSPHLHRFQERIAINGDHLTESQLAGLVATVRDSGMELSYFEFATVMALLHFERMSLDIALLEVGLGGRWDATNATDPLLSVITSVSVDHEGWLGDTVERIAGEKAMIMRPGRPVVINGVGPEARRILLDHSSSLQSRVMLGGRDFTADWEDDAAALRFRGARWDLSGLTPGLKGLYQRENTATALAALECLDRIGFPVAGEPIVRGLADARWPGRFEDLGGDPKVIVDSAHNPSAAKALAESLGPGRDAVWLFGCLKDKDLEGMAEELTCAGRRFVLVPIDHPRACSVDDLERKMPDNVEMKKAPSVKEGIRTAVDMAGKDGTVVTAGSIYLAAAVLEEMKIRYKGSGIQNTESRS